MGRSGSSAFTRVLSLCGAALPLRMLAPNFGNPTGYWEPALAVEINDRYLRARASSWYDTDLGLQMRPAPSDAVTLVSQAAELLTDSFEPSGPIVIKEPRISGLLPYWIQGAEAAGLRPVIVHLFRNPDEVAASLARRDFLPKEQSRALWLKYNLVAERDGRGFARAFISYDDLLTDWEDVVGRCARELGLDLAISDRTRVAVAGFLSVNLRHHASPAEVPVADDDSRLVTRTYQLLKNAKRTPVAASEFESLLAEYRRWTFKAVGPSGPAVRLSAGRADDAAPRIARVGGTAAS